MRSSVGLLALLALLIALPSMAQTVISGRVLETRKNTPIRGVEVELKNAKTDKPVAPIQTTNQQGYYHFEVNEPASAELVAYFRLSGYIRNPADQKVVRQGTGGTKLALQQPVRLTKEDEETAYFKDVGTNVAQQSAESPASTQAFFASVLSLPSAKKALVFEGMQATNKAVYEEALKADRTATAAREVESKVRDFFPDFKVSPHFDALGTIRLTGSVKSAAERDAIMRQIGNNVGGNTRIRNDILVNNQ